MIDSLQDSEDGHASRAGRPVRLSFLWHGHVLHCPHAEQATRWYAFALFYGNWLELPWWRLRLFIPRNLLSLRPVNVYDEWKGGTLGGSVIVLVQSTASRRRVDSMFDPTIWTEQRRSWSTSRRRRRWIIQHQSNVVLKKTKVGVNDTELIHQFRWLQTRRRQRNSREVWRRRTLWSDWNRRSWEPRWDCHDPIRVTCLKLSFKFNSYVQAESTKSNGKPPIPKSEIMKEETFKKDEDKEQASKKIKEGGSCLLPT